MIIIVAPYSPIALSSHPHLGAARKIEMVIETLSELDLDIVLVNSAHNELNKKAYIDKLKIGNVTVTHVIPACYGSQKLGKLLNLKDASKAVTKCLELGKPKLLWIYNSYAFENLFSKLLCKKLSIPVVLEFEDWHFSRSRGINPKPFIDHLFWKLNLNNINFSFGVNDNLVNKMKGYKVLSQLLPGIVSANLIEQCDQKTIFKCATVRIGYFGGLSDEKGVSTIIDIVGSLPEGLKLVLSGAGPLESELTSLASVYPEKLEFHGRVTDTVLYELITSVDVVLNPHSPISHMAEGVFPFKVVEAIASGRLLISTDLPAANLPNFLDGVLFYDGSSESLLNKIIEVASFYENNIEVISKSKLIAREAFSKESLLKPIAKLLQPIEF